MKFTILIICTLSCVIFSLFIGTVDLSFIDVLKALLGRGTDTNTIIVRELRLPRSLTGAVIGAGLGASGAALQGYTRNPLAAPGILGFTACAALGAVIALYFGFYKWIPLAALSGTAIGAFLILKISGIPMLEKNMESHPDFENYKKKVNAFFPRIRFLNKN